MGRIIFRKKANPLVLTDAVLERERERERERDETNAEMIQFLESGQQMSDRSSPSIQTPHQNNIDLTAPRCFHELLAGFPFDRAGADLTNLHRDGPAAPDCIFPQRTRLHRASADQ